MMPRLILANCLILFAAVAQAAPMNLYLTSGDSREFYLVQGAVVTTFAANPNSAEYAIAVQSTVRLLSAYNSLGFNGGREYTLAGVPTGTTYTNNLTSQLLDGTTDGTHNYTIAWNTGNVYQFDANWANPTLLFNVPGTNDEIGITYDPSNNSLWVLDRATNRIANYTLAGGLLSSFSMNGAGSRAPLAMDYADGTLWTLNRANWTLEQYSRTGAFLSSSPYNGPRTNILGGEFPFQAATEVPEPVSLLIWGAGGLGLAAFARRSRTQAA